MHPAVEVVYRPALAKRVHQYKAVARSGDPAKLEECECELVADHVVTLNGEKGPDKARAGRVNHVVRGRLLDLILSLEPAAVPPETSLGNSAGQSG